MIVAVLDVNVVISAVISPHGAPRQILEAWRGQAFLSVTSDGIIAEVAAKLLDPGIGGRFKIRPEEAHLVTTFLRTQAQVIEPPAPAPPITGDAEDDHVLATARACGAQYLVTGDKRLVALGRHHETAIVSPRQFLAVLASADTVSTGE